MRQKHSKIRYFCNCRQTIFTSKYSKISKNLIIQILVSVFIKSTCTTVQVFITAISNKIFRKSKLNVVFINVLFLNSKKCAFLIFQAIVTMLFPVMTHKKSCVQTKLNFLIIYVWLMMIKIVISKAIFNGFDAQWRFCYVDLMPDPMRL